MSLIALWFAVVAYAQGTAVWFGGPVEPAATGEVVDVSADDMAANEEWNDMDERAIAHLAEELEAVRPLVAEFDGELEIMARLGRALTDVHVIRNEADRDLVYAALLFQGFAVRRYFQDDVETDPAAAPYRVAVGEVLEVAPWVDAVALVPDREATAALIPEEPERLAFAASRARLKVARPAVMEVAHVPEGAHASVDGRMVGREPDGAVRIRVLPGRHRVAVWQGQTIIARLDSRLEPGDYTTLIRSPTPAEVEHTRGMLVEGGRSVRLEPVVAQSLVPLEHPVRLVAPVEDGLHVFVLEGGWATRESAPEPPPEPEPETPLYLEIAAALGWMYDVGFARTNEDDGAPKGLGTTHAVPVVIGVEVTSDASPLTVGAGLDLAAPTGRWHVLRDGDRAIRLRPHPYASIGPQSMTLRFTVGMLMPWHAAVGVRGTWPLAEGVVVKAAWVQAFGLPSADHAGIAHLAFVGIGSRLP